MSSPVTAEDFNVVNTSGTVCDQISQVLAQGARLKEWFAYAFNSDGSISDAFKADLSAAGVGLPVGSIFFMPVQTVPAGCLLANGQNVSRTLYAGLFSVYGTSFGSGDGSTTFGLPDCTGLFLRGAGGIYAVGATGGADTVTLTLAQIPAHNHGMPTDANAIRTTLSPGSGNNNDDADQNGGGFMGLATFVADGGGQAHENLPSFRAGLWLIKT
jgi:microcystin-dependent protein